MNNNLTVLLTVTWQLINKNPVTETFNNFDSYHNCILWCESYEQQGELTFTTGRIFF